MEKTVERTFIHIARSRLVVHLTEQIRVCLQALNDEQIWWRPNEDSNSIGNLVLHCCGSTHHYIGHVIGNSGFTRDRDAEFSERVPIPKDELLRRLSVMAAEADRVLSELEPTRLLEITERTPKPSTYMQVIGQQLAHYAAHAGQIAYATKLLKAGAIDDIWRKTPTR